MDAAFWIECKFDIAQHHFRQAIYMLDVYYQEIDEKKREKLLKKVKEMLENLNLEFVETQLKNENQILQKEMKTLIKKLDNDVDNDVDFFPSRYHQRVMQSKTYNLRSRDK